MRRFLVLIAIFLAATVQLSGSISAEEARLLWIVRDVVDIKSTASPREFARNMLQNVNSTWDRSRETRRLPIYPLVLDGWTFLTGDSVEMARLLPAFGAMIFAAVIMRRTRRHQWVWVGLILVVVALRFMNPTPDWKGTVENYLQARNPLHPVLITFTPDSELGYYDHRYNLRRGIAVDVSWQEFDNESRYGIVEKFKGYPVWVIMPENQFSTHEFIQGLYEKYGYIPDSTIPTGNMMFASYIIPSSN